jgi:hypothetical protein
MLKICVIDSSLSVKLKSVIFGHKFLFYFAVKNSLSKFVQTSVIQPI